MATTDRPSRLATWSAKKQALFAQRLRAMDSPAGPPAIARRQERGAVQLSFAQERLWFLQRLDPESSAYHIPLVLDVHGELQPAIVERALATVVRRHEALRTLFVSGPGGEPRQLVTPPQDRPLPVLDLSPLPPPWRAAETGRLAGCEAMRRFDLETGPPVRALLLRRAERDWTLLVTIHHLVSDGWSMEVLVGELGALYKAYAAGLPAPLPDLPIQYADYALWQRGWLAGQELARQLGHWREALAGVPLVLDLPTDRPRPPAPRYHAGFWSQPVPGPVMAEWRGLGRALSATPFMLVLTLFQLLLARWTGRLSLLVGSPVANRDRPETAGLIGLFANTLVLRGDLSEGLSFPELVGQTRQRVIEAFAHQDLPFARLVEELQPQRELATSPLFQALLVWQETPAELPAALGLRFTPRPDEAVLVHAKFELVLAWSEAADGGATMTWEYAAELFDRTTVARMAAGFENLLVAAVSRPASRLWQLPLLSAAEAHQLLAECNDTATAYPPVACLHYLFAAQAARTPEAEAVSCEAGSLTYRGLARAAGRLARRLRAEGVGPEAVVGVLLERSLEMIVALYGVLQAGGAYLPLDPSYPADRLAAFVEDAAPRLVLTVSALAPLVPAGARVMLLDAGAPGDETGKGAEGHLPPLPDSLAYVIFTSGSTGRPKGVMNAHGGIVNRILWMQEAYGLAPDDRVLQKTPFSFDVSVWELFWPLAVGACLVLARPGGHRDPGYLTELIAREGITTLHFVPSMLQAFLEAPGIVNCTAVRRVITSGEELTAEVAVRCLERLAWAELHNLYGPTEAAVDVTAWPCRRGELGARVPIGRPIANLKIHLLDAGRPVPLGVPGELYIGGVGVGRGYLGRPELTAERFVPDPLGEAPGARLYRTGDLARRRPDGAVDFLGRIDHQVKIRGFRIELGEIEAALAQVPGIKAAVVGVREARGDRQLVAYLAVDRAAVPARGVVRDLLRARLPEAMVPAAFVTLDALPLSPNGKVDRKALARLTPEADRRPEEGAERRTPVEELVTGIWAEILGLDTVGLAESFFDLGGHSLLATRVVKRLQQVLGVEVSLRQFFQAPTVAAQAALVAAGRSGGALAPRPAIVPVPRGAGGVPLSFAQERLWFLQRLDPQSSAYHIPLALDLHGALDEVALERALGEVVRRHEALRTTFTEEEGEPRQRAAPPWDPLLPRVDLAALPVPPRAAEVRRLAGSEALRPFDLAAGSPARACLLRREPGAWTLLLTLHHIVSDAWSMEVLVRELGALYTAAASGLPSPLAELPIQYADYALWQRGWLAGEALDLQLDHWRRALAGAPLVLELPTDRRRPAVQRFRAGAWTQALPEPAAAALRGLGRALAATPFMLVLALFQSLLSRWTGQDDLLVGSPVANRDRVETEGLIGFFVNTLLLRGDLSGEPCFADLLERARRTVLEAVSHQDLPFEKLVAELQPERDLAASPLFQVLLVWQGAPAAPPALPDLRLAPWEEVAGTGAKFDLTLSWSELPGGGAATFWEYDADLFDRVTVARLAAQLETLVDAVLAQPQARISELSPFAPAERQQLLGEWADGGVVDASKASSLSTLFEAQAVRAPEALALIAGEERLTYAELNRRADALARRLRRAGVRPEALVGVLAERSAALVAGLLGVLKAGGAYVPIDPAAPRERQAFLLADAGASVLLASGRYAAVAAEIAGAATVVDLDQAAGGEDAAGIGPAVSGSGAGPGNLAYVIYTSGSTGVPKGVAIEHRSAVAMVEWARQAYSAEELAGVLFATSIGFDLSVFELFAPLAAGGCVVLAENALELPLLPGAAEVRLVNTVPSAIAELVRAGSLPAGVRTVNLAGEPLTRALADRIHALGTVDRLFNLYGPSEDTTYSTFTGVPAGDAREPSIGRPLPGSRAYVLDRHRRPAPQGAPGELHLAGEGLARGYLNRPSLTAERFLPDPFGTAGGRLYATGDLSRWRPDGALEFLGRSDHQVKVRGFRIELGEIEAALLRCAGVRAAAVLAVDAGDGGGDRRLVAFVAADGEAREVTGRLRAAVADRLPAYMVPAAFAVLDALPLTPNGKVDRKALARIEVGAAAGGSALPLRTAWEELTAELWAEVLGVPAAGLGPGGHFFELGGHSLLAARVISRVGAVLGVELPLRLLFERPTLERFATALDEAVRGGGRSALPPLTRTPRQAPLPLSFAQERLWLLDQLEPGSPAYNLPVALRIDGRLDERALAGSLAEIVRRHEVLRTVFPAGEGQPRQEVQPAALAALPVIDLSALDPERRETLAGALLRAEASRPFDLAAGPLLRALLVRLDDARRLVLFNMHHIASDAWSLGLFARELAALYAALAAGEPLALPDLPVQYADFAVWQRSWLSGEELERQLAFWRGELAGAAPRLDLPVDHPRERSAAGPAGTLSLAVPDQLAHGLLAAARREGATLFMVLLAAFQAVLSRSAGQADVSVGTPVAGRNRLETEALIGFFINTLVLRTVVSGAEPLDGLVRRVRGTVLGALAHQDLPFERLVEALQPERSLDSTPLFQVLFNLQNTPAAAPALRGLELAPVPLAPARAKFDLTLAGAAHGEGLELTLIYDRGLFDAATIERFAGRLERVLATLVGSPACRVEDLPLLAAAERRQLLADWGRGPAAPIPALAVHQLIETQADRTPEAPALVFEDEVLSYRELDRRANRLAHRLRRLGVGSEDRVGICLEHSGEAIVALLAVLKAGAAYVPLDPAYPAPRLAVLIADAAARAVVTREPLLPLLPPAVAALSVEAAGLAGESGDRPELAVDPRQLAYLLFTSGSTGRPKGVAVEHRQVVHYVSAVRERLDLPEPASFALVSTLSADLGNTSLFPALASGGTLHVLAAERATDPEAMADYFERHRVDCLKIVPSHLRALRTGSRPDGVLPRQRLVLGGEALSWQEADALAAAAPCTLLNHYGPTETTVGVATCEVAAAVRRGATVPLGRPLRNVQAYLLDPDGSLLPPETPGDLHLGGSGVARGYWGRPDLTAERFVPDPFGGEPGARLYRTGDRVRFLPAGQLQFLGRFDLQVKVRGYRVELGEVEAALAGLAGVREAAVAVLGEGETRRLAAYVVPAGGALDVGRLRDALRERLPDFLVPGEWMVLPRLPLNANGKVDRRALPTPRRESSWSVAPRDEEELALARLWEELLGVDPVGVHDSFFELGGQSLLAVRLLARIERGLGVRLSLADLLQAPTVAGLARRLRDREPASRRSLLVPIRPRGSAPPLFWVHPVGGSVFCYLEIARRLGGEQPSYGLRSPGPELPEIELPDLAALYLAEIRTAQPAGPYRLAGWSMGGVLAFEMARQLEAAGEAVDLLVLLDVGPPGPAELEDPATELLLFTRDLGGLLAASTDIDPAELERLVAAEPSLDRLWATPELRAALPADLDLERLRDLFTVFRRNLRTVRRYRPERYGGGLMLVQSAESAASSELIVAGWRGLTGGELRVEVVPGDHFSLLRPPALETLVCLISGR